MRQQPNIRTLCLDALWLAVLVVGLPWLLWRFVFQGKNRRGWKQKLLGRVALPEKRVGSKRIWFHAVSVGEVHLLNTIIEPLRQQQPDVEIVVSTTTETGFDRAMAILGERYPVFFFPLDFSWAIRSAFRRVDADLIVLAELELWPNLIHLASEYNLPVVVANGRLSEKSHRNYCRFHWLVRSMFQKLHRVAAQDSLSGDRFVDLGCDADRVTVTGNLKYDAIETRRKNPVSDACRRIARNLGMPDSAPILIAGSTQIEDELVAVDAWLKLRDRFPSLKLIIVPRHPERIGEVESALAYRNLSANRRTRPEKEAIDSDILIVDVLGELSGWWALADVAFVGGSMGSRGGQNMIEPAAFGIPVCFGPNTANFTSTVDGLLANRAAEVVTDSLELADFVSRMLRAPTSGGEMGKRAQEFVLEHRGAAAKTVAILEASLGIENLTRDSKRAA